MWGGGKFFWGGHRGGQFFFSGPKGGTKFHNFFLRLRRNSFLDTSLQNFSQKPKGGPEIFPIGEGEAELFCVRKGDDQKKMVTTHHKQMDPPPAKNDTSLTPWSDHLKDLLHLPCLQKKPSVKI